MHSSVRYARQSTDISHTTYASRLKAQCPVVVDSISIAQKVASLFHELGWELYPTLWDNDDDTPIIQPRQAPKRIVAPVEYVFMGESELDILPKTHSFKNIIGTVFFGDFEEPTVSPPPLHDVIIELLSNLIEELEASPCRWEYLKEMWIELTDRPLDWYEIAECSYKFPSVAELFDNLPEDRYNAKSIWGKLINARNIRFLYNYYISLERFLTNHEEQSLENIMNDAYHITTLPISTISNTESLQRAITIVGKATFLINNLNMPRLIQQNDRPHLAHFRFGDIVLRRIWSLCIKRDGFASLPDTLRESIIAITQQSSQVVQQLIARVCDTDMSYTRSESIDSIVMNLDYFKENIEKSAEKLKATQHHSINVLERLDEFDTFNDFFRYEMIGIDVLASNYKCNLQCIRWINVLLYSKKTINNRIANVLPLINNPSASVVDKPNIIESEESSKWSSNSRSRDITKHRGS